MKNVIMLTLKYLIEQLNFSDREFNFDSPAGILWPIIDGIYKIVEKNMKKEILKDYAF